MPWTPDQLDGLLTANVCTARVSLRHLRPAQQAQVLERLHWAVRPAQSICWNRGEMMGEHQFMNNGPLFKVFITSAWWRIHSEVTTVEGFMFAASASSAIYEELVLWLFGVMAERLEDALAEAQPEQVANLELAAIRLDELARRLNIELNFRWPTHHFADRDKNALIRAAFDAP